MASKEQVFYSEQDPGTLAKLVTTVKAVTGVAAAATIAVDIPTEIIAVLAVTTATGAAATKLLLAPTTDYTLSASRKVLTCVTDQSANTLLIIYN